jgi:hypothetical protein
MGDRIPYGIGGQKMKMFFVRRSSIVLSLAAISGCGGSAVTAPSVPIAGSYSATDFVTTGSSGQTNQILVGSTLDLILLANGTVSGLLHMAASAANPAFDADMNGTWTRTGNTIAFSQAADTFVRNMTFTVVPNVNSWQLVGDQVLSGTLFKLTLRQVIVYQ